ncbi:secondary metabolism biosynthetic enzyme [Penicillium citrinum]|uniref:Secondary metabolism biosynthetic enzyme n=1 Tax=Penicillium citrinum TaxID=5077 RepID=A0A9W9PF19_PENCI|nr:secondary metabolism biosynthetic enzyme [Penicillium citrinum]KAJ5243276.1 secondary metabolism biosynthetic enzyme [Penicillium citrinum]
MTDRLQQIHQQLEPVGLEAHPDRLDGQPVLTSGTYEGIGRATALVLARRGAKVAINDLDREKAEKLAKEIRSFQGEAEVFCGNVLEEAFPQLLVSSVLQKWGKINCLINNAGFCHDSAIHKMDDGKFDIIMKIHNYVPFRMVRALSGHWMDPVNRPMPKVIVNVSSTSGLHGSMGQINYATAKAGVLGLTKTIAAEWGRFNVRANAVAYGWIDTRITRPPTKSETLEVGGQAIRLGIPENAKKWRDVSDIPLGRPGSADEAARVILFLASPLSSYMTGTCIECTGGRFM